MTAARIDELRSKFEENPRRYFAPLANEYRKSGDLEQAIALCREYLPHQPGHMSGHIVYGQALYETGELDEARGVFETALDLDPENLIALRHLGDIARARGDLAMAKRWYERVLEADPRNDDIAAQLAALAAQRRTPALPTPVIEPAAAPAATIPTPALLDDALLSEDLGLSGQAEADPSSADLVDAATAAAWLPAAAVEAAGADLPEVESGVGDLLGQVAETDVATEPTADASGSWPAVETDPIPVAVTDVDTAESPSASMDAPAELPTAVEPSADALTEALDAFATWEVGSTTPQAVDAALPSEGAVETAEPAGAAGPDESFEAGFFVPEWPTDLDAVGPRTPASPMAAVDQLPSDDLAEPIAPLEAAIDDGVATAATTALQALEDETGESGADLVPVEAERSDSAWLVDSAVSESGEAADESPMPILEVHDTVGAGTERGEVDWDLSGIERQEELTPADGVAEPMLTVESATAADQSAGGIAPLAGFEPTHDEDPGAESEWAPAVTTSDAPSMADGAEGEPIITETVAELYLQQGLFDRALAVYRELAARAPDDVALADRVRELEGELAPTVPGRTAGAWFAALAARRVTRGARPDPVEAEAAEPGLASLFTSSPDPADERAAAVWSQAFGGGEAPLPSAEEALFEGASGEGDVPAGAASATMRALAPASAPTGDTFSFEQFFAPPATEAPRDGAPNSAATTTEGAPPPAADLANFAAWLRGLAG
jgi:tetratricopeptide (TPR) repeat protein